MEVNTGSKVLLLPTMKTLPMDVLMSPNSLLILIFCLNLPFSKWRCNPAAALNNKLWIVMSSNNSRKKSISNCAAFFGYPLLTKEFLRSNNCLMPFEVLK